MIIEIIVIGRKDGLFTKQTAGGWYDSEKERKKREKKEDWSFRNMLSDGSPFPELAPANPLTPRQNHVSSQTINSIMIDKTSATGYSNRTGMWNCGYTRCQIIEGYLQCRQARRGVVSCHMHILTTHKG